MVWTATVVGARGERVTVAVIGETAEAALRDAARHGRVVALRRD